MPRTIAPKDRLLVSFTEAQNLLSVSKMELLRDYLDSSEEQTREALKVLVDG
jgi:hypothetical protein